MRISPADIGGAARCLHSWSRRCSAASALPPSYDSERLVENRRFFTRNLPDLSECSWGGDAEAAIRGTLALLRKGRTWIQGAILAHGDLAGEIDLLRKVDEPSLLGSHGYRPVLLRFQPRMDREDVYPVIAAADLLAPLLGARPRRGEVWLSSGERVEVDLDESRAAYEKLLSEMNQVREGTLRTRPYRCGICESCPW